LSRFGKPVIVPEREGDERPFFEGLVFPSENPNSVFFFIVVVV